MPKIMIAIEFSYDENEDGFKGMAPHEAAQLTFNQIEEGELTILDLVDQGADLIVNGYPDE